MSTHRTNRGEILDFDKIMTNHKHVVATGNMQVNANGDVLGQNGEIVQKNEERVRAYYKDNPRSSTRTQSIKDPLPVDNAITEAQKDAVPNIKEQHYEEITDEDGNIEVITYANKDKN